MFPTRRRAGRRRRRDRRQSVARPSSRERAETTASGRSFPRSSTPSRATGRGSVASSVAGRHVGARPAVARARREASARARVSDARAPREDGEDDDIDSDDDAGAHDGPYVLRCGATGAAGLPEDVTFDVGRARGWTRRNCTRSTTRYWTRSEETNRFERITSSCEVEAMGWITWGRILSTTRAAWDRRTEREHGEDMKTMIGRLRKSKRDSEEYELELIPIAGGRIIDLEARLHKYNYTKHSRASSPT